jgi:hypothetical protein
MGRKIPHIEKKELIRTELLKCARAKPIEILSYSDFGRRVQIVPRGPGKKLLDLIAREQNERQRPDITVLLVRKDSGYPGQIDGIRSKNPTPQQKIRAREKLREVIDVYNRGAPNPF